MKKGFTLIEMIAGLTILSVILMISVPQVTNMLKNEENNKYEQFLTEITLATETYISKKNDEFPELKIVNGTTCINLEDIVGEHLLASSQKNTKTDESVLASSIQVTLNSDYQYDYIYQDGTKCQ